MFGVSVGNFFKSSPKPLDVREGALYRHSEPSGLRETAEVLHVGPDFMGITHVRYRVMVEREREQQFGFEDARILNIETFADYFSETVDA